MPLIIDQDLKTGAAPTGPKYTPKIFHKDITGSGGATGRINADVHPAAPDLSYEPFPKVNAPTKDQIDGETTARTLVVTPWLEQSLEEVISQIWFDDCERRRQGPSAAELAERPYLFHMDVPELLRHSEVTKRGKTSLVANEQMFDVTSAMGITIPGYQIWLDLTPQLVVLRSRGVTDSVTGKNIWTHTNHIRYRMDMFVIAEHEHTADLLDDNGDQVLDVDGNPRTAPSISRIATVTNVEQHKPLTFDGVDSFAVVNYAFDVPSLLEELLIDLADYLDPKRSGYGGPVPIDQAAFARWSEEEYRLYQRLCHAAESFATEEIADQVMDLTDQLYRSVAARAAARGDKPSRSDMAAIVPILEFLDNFSIIPLEAYTTIYKSLVDLDSDGAIAAHLVNCNVQLKQNAELSRLAEVKPDMPVPGPVDPTRWTIDPRYSVQQRKAIETTEPLVMVVAGAGAGKSTVVTERISMLTRGCGVNPASIQVWSFTNAAADEIRDRNPGIVSKTIALAIHEIYMVNFPEQQLSTMETISNSIKIHFGARAHTDDVLLRFIELTERISMRGGESNANIIALNNFIAEHTSEVVTILSTIGQTTLELEIILSYLLIDNDNYIEPFASPDYLIIDEVQDNSAFQFVYAMRYAAKHKCSLYLVGDAAQTLYEFRAANPKALTSLEASGVFEVCKLSTNYRSKQEILDFANFHLDDIEANRFAGIQLDANALAESTAASFQETVKLVSKTCRTQRAFVENLKSYMTAPVMREYLEANLERGETTTVLAYSRHQVKLAEEALQKMFPDEPVLNLTSERPFTSTTFSSYIAKYWDEVTCVDPKSASFTFTKQVMAHLPDLEHNSTKIEKIVEGNLIEWWSTNAQSVNFWLDQVTAGVMHPDEFFYKLRQSILDYEIAGNAVRTSLLNQKKAARKEELLRLNPKLMISTIHGVKGMEFDNVVLILPPESKDYATDEAYKRMLYVALTRAKGSELILAGVASAKPRIEMAYNAVVEALERREAAAAAAAVLDPEQDVIEEVEEEATDPATATGAAGAVSDASQLGSINATGTDEAASPLGAPATQQAPTEEPELAPLSIADLIASANAGVSAQGPGTTPVGQSSDSDN